jgi:hypothetical protein
MQYSANKINETTKTVLKNNVEVSKQGQANTDLLIKYSMKYLHLRGVG